MSRRLRLALLTMMALAASCGRSPDAAEQHRLEEEFARTMKQVVLVGKFQLGDRVVEDRYHVQSASKVAGSAWVIQARWGKLDVPIPVPVKVEWAGDTPVILLTDAGIPGLGSFTARVLIYRNHYAGFWANSKGQSGQMWGKLEPAGG